MGVPRVLLVVPCYNEASRLDINAFCTYALAEEGVGFIFVDDGSTDATAEVLQGVCREIGTRARVLAMPENAGKAEAVRRGLLEALATPAAYVGFWDADLATPLTEVAALAAALDASPGTQAAIGSRVKLLGRHIDRLASRHYLGRVFATAASLLLRAPVYDTQCGAKLFRSGPATAELLRAPFLTKWIFDVELLARLALAYGPLEDTVREVPLATWVDKAGSKVRPVDFARAGPELLRIHGWYRSAANKKARVQ